MLKQRITFLEQTWKTVEITGNTQDEIDDKVYDALDSVSEVIDFDKNPDMYEVKAVNRYPVEEV